MDTVINLRLRFGYDIGKGFVVGEEELLQQFDKIVSMVPNKSIAQELRRRVETSRLDVIRSLGELWAWLVCHDGIIKELCLCGNLKKLMKRCKKECNVSTSLGAWVSCGHG